MRQARTILGLAVALPMLAASGAFGQTGDFPISISTLSGPAEVQPTLGVPWVPAKLGVEIGSDGGARTTGIGRMALRTKTGHAIRLGSGTQVRFAGDAPTGEDQPLRLSMEGIRLWVAVAPGSGRSPRVEVRAGPATVAIGGSGVAFRIGADGSVLVRVFHGSAACSGPQDRRDWTRSLKAGEELLVPASGAPGQPRKLSRDSSEGMWERWNEEQDAAAYGGPPVPK